MTLFSHGLAAAPVAPGLAPLVRRGAMAAWAMMEPTLPEAAAMP